MAEKPKLDVKKVILLFAPILIGLIVYTLFFKDTPDAPKYNAKGELIIPDSKGEDLSEKKSEIYSQEMAKKRAVRREEEDEISSSAFFSAVTKEKKEEEKDVLTEEEKKQELEKFFSESDKEKGHKTKSQSSFYIPDKKSKWEVEDVPDPLETYNYEKKQKGKKGIPRSAPDTVKLADPVKKKEEINTIPGQRTRNNNISSDLIQADGNMVPAVIHDDQVVTNGSTVKIRLLQDIFVEGQKIPKNTFVYGIARFNNERVGIQLQAIRMKNTRIPFQKNVIDKDGIEGLYFPNNIGNEMSKEVGGEGIDEAYDRAISGTGVVGSVLSAGKSVLKRRNIEKKVTLKANYNIFLK